MLLKVIFLWTRDARDEFKEDLKDASKSFKYPIVIQQIGSAIYGWSSNPTKREGKAWSLKSDTDFAVFSLDALEEGGTKLEPNNQFLLLGQYCTLNNGY